MTDNAKNNDAEGAVLTVIEGNGAYVHRFNKTFEYEGKKYETLKFDFASLKGKDVIAIETEMQANNEYVLAPEISRSFQCKMASRASGVGSDVLQAMSLYDFNRITNAARDFLLSNLGN